MKVPDLTDIVAELQERLDNLEAQDTDFGDPENTTVTIPEITDLDAVVTYHAAPITKTPYAKITWSWSEPLMFDENNNPIDPNDPVVASDLNLDPVVNYMFGTSLDGGVASTFTSTNGETTVVTDGHALGVNVSGSVYAVTRSGISGPVAVYEATVSKDTTAPPKPSAPVLSSSMGTVSGTYDGLDYLGNPMPNDLMDIEIYAGTTNPPTEKVDSLSGAGQFIFASVVNSTIYVQLVARDTSYNSSAGSDVVSITVASVLDDTDLMDLLATKAEVYITDTEPTGTITDNSLWYTVTSPRKLYRYTTGDWIEYDFDAASVLTAGSIIASNLGAESVTTDALAANSVVADKIATDAIVARHIKAGEVLADKIGTGVLNAILTISQAIQTAASGSRVVINSDGLTLYNSSGDATIKIATSGESSFSGDMTATSLTVIGPMSLTDDLNIISPGAVLQVNASIGNPTTAPTVNGYYDSTQLKNSSGNNPGAYEFQNIFKRASDGKFLAVSEIGALEVAIATFSTTGVFESLSSTYDLTSYVDNDSILRYAFSDTYLYVVSTVGNSTSRTYRLVSIEIATGTIRVQTNSDFTVTDMGFPMLGTKDDTSIVFGGTKFVSGANTSKFVTHTVGSITGTTFTLSAATTKINTATFGYGEVRAVGWGNFDFGFESLVAVIGGLGGIGYDEVRVTKYSDTSDQADLRFVIANDIPTSINYYSGKIYIGATEGICTFYDGVTFTGSSTTKSCRFAYTFYDNNATNGTHETKASPVKSYTVARRQKVRITVQNWTADTSGDDTVTHLKFYASQSAGSVFLLGSSTSNSYNTSSIPTSGTASPATNDFPAASPGVIKSQTAGWELYGDGTKSGLGPKKTVLNQTAPSTTSAQTASFNINTETITSVTYKRTIRMIATLNATVAASSDWRIRMGWGDDSDVADPDNIFAEQALNNVAGSSARMSCTLVAEETLNAGESKIVRVYAARASGTLTPINPAGYSLQIIGVEIE